MDHLPTVLYNKQQIREIERIAIDELAVPEYTLMQRAGMAAWSYLTMYWTDVKKIAVLCGPGNNGGDGLILARLAKEQGKNVTVYTVGDHSKSKDTALLAMQDCQQAGIVIKPWTTAIEESDVIVDAILGIGLHEAVKSPYREAIAAINAAHKPTIAIDVPSGIDIDTGCVLGDAVRADVTVTFLGLKQGLLTGQAPDYCGKIHCDFLGLPEIVLHKPGAATRISYEEYKNKHWLLPARKPTAHKGNFGHVVVIGGDFGYTGAVSMAAEAAARTGAGLTSVATRYEHTGAVTTICPEVMAHGVSQPNDLDYLLEKATVVAIGPGLGQSPWAQELLAYMLQSNLPLILDADALNLLSSEPLKRGNWVLTPHPGEAARLLDSDTASVQCNRFTAALALQEKYDGVVILKGAGTLIIDEQKHISICSDGNPGMASGGMGDVLTGVIAGLCAQRLSLANASRLAVCLHSRAADLARQNGERGMLATDLMPYIRQLVNP